jgi:hypothetical protein
METARNTPFTGDFTEVKNYYSELRRLLYNKVMTRYPQFLATPISYKDCIEADSWSKQEPNRRNQWYWTTEHAEYQRFFKRFDLAFKQGGKLVSLSYGVPTAHKTGLKINIIESTPIKVDKLGIKGFETMSYAAQIYAAMLGANEIRIMTPTSSKARAHYCSFGYKYVSNAHKPSLPDYCVLELK